MTVFFHLVKSAPLTGQIHIASVNEQDYGVKPVDQ